MNKKFSTLAAALLLAGSFSANAQQNVASSVTNGHVYYLNVTSSTFTAIDVASDGSKTVKTDVVEGDLTTYAQWQLVGEVTVNGVKNYMLKNVETGDILSYDTSSSSMYQLNGANKYVAFDNATEAKLTYGTAANLYLKEIDPITSNPTELNNNQGWKKGFALEAENAAHKQVVTVEPNVFMNGKIQAIPLNAETGGGSKGSFWGVTVDGYESGTAGYSTWILGTVSNNVMLRVSGEWNGEPLYRYEVINANGDKGWAPDAKAIEKFRASKFIVMDKEVYSNFATNVTGAQTKGYKFTVVTGAELINKEGNNDWTAENTSVTHHILNAVFDIKQDPTVPACANDLIISVPNTYVWKYNSTTKKYEYVLAKDDSNNKLPAYVAIFNFEGKNYLASTNEMQEAIDSHLTLKDNMLVGQKDWAGKIVNISTANTSWTAESEEVSVAYIDGTVPEGQWIVEGGQNNKPGAFSFANRESEKEFTLKAANGSTYTSYTVYKTATANKYEVVYNSGKDKRDLIITVAPARTSIFEDYANLDETKFADQTYNISVVTSLYENVYLAETGLAKTVELTADKAEAGAWKLTKWCANKDYEAGIEKPDTIYHFNNIDFWNPKHKDGARWDTYTDTLAMFAYTIQNEAGKYLIYNDIKKSYEVNDLKKDQTARENAPKFIFKEKHGKTNILALAAVNFKSSSDKSWKIENDATANYADKLFGAFSYNKVDKEANIYNVIDNDLFAIEEVSAPEYRRIAGMDTIKIFKEDNNSDILFEHNGFLAMEHLSDFADMKPAMFADTAYVRYETRKPQYLLVVNPNQVIDKEECEIVDHPHAQADTLYGRFLVNLVDSAKAYAATESKLENPYMWEGGYKLAFRAGKHTGDKLIMDVANPTAADTIALGNNANKIGAYAFRYVDRENESFVIETSLDGTDKPGYIKWLNGTPVVIAERDKAEVFNLAETEEAPTDNEEVVVSEISVVAANGAVIVKGAAGKNVVITNVLGKQIANETVSSDNATFAAPAGIVVVAVEGEEAVKVVVK